jgi:hypothetical protein
MATLMAALLLVACGAPAPGPMTWLDRPLDGAALALAPVTIQAHASDADGVASFEFFVNEAPLVTASADGGRLGQAMVEWNPTEPGTYTIRARGIDSQGNVGSDAISVVTVGRMPEPSPTVPPGPEEGEIIFLVEPEAIPAGACAVLYWEVHPSADALLNGEQVPPVGETEVCPPETTTYELLVPERGQVRMVTLHVEREPEPPSEEGVRISFTADRTNLRPGECTTLRWNVEGGFAVELNEQPVERSGQSQVCPPETIPYVIAVDAGDRLERREVVISVEREAQPTPTTLPAPSPTAPSGCPGSPLISFFTADPSTIVAGQPSTLSWGPVTNGDSDVLVRSVVISPALGEVGSPGSRVVHPQSTTTYTMVATGCGGTAQQQVTVVVNPAAFSADLAITDLYPETNYGPVWFRITNHGPGTASNVTVQLSCQWARTISDRPLDTGQMGPMPIPISSLSPGQTQAFNTDIPVDLHQYQYDVTCTIQVPFSDPNPGNNSYSESFP